ncbi:MAG TPA: HAD-IA family hydrolase [Candidatus Binataceae bacterium]|nr:HAD-IA family hydrolase [Candidatus Binataceae bacterium]
MLKVVFFDAAGTLIAPRAPVGATYARIAHAYGIDAAPDEVNAGFRRAFHAALPLAFGPDHEAGELRRLEYQWWSDVVAKSFDGLGVFTNFDAYFRQLFVFFSDPSNWRIDPMALSTLDQLRARGLKLGLVSNFDYRLYRILSGLGLGAQFDSITISSEAGYAKPSPEIFRIAMRQHGVASREVIHVGDALELDVAGALAAGITPLLLDPSAPARTAIEGPTVRIATLDAIPEALDQLAFP